MCDRQLNVTFLLNKDQVFYMKNTFEVDFGQEGTLITEGISGAPVFGQNNAIIGLLGGGKPGSEKKIVVCFPLVK